MKKSASAITHSVPVWLAGRCVFELDQFFCFLWGCWVAFIVGVIVACIMRMLNFLFSVLLRSRRAMGYRLKILSIEMTGKQKREWNQLGVLFYSVCISSLKKKKQQTPSQASALQLAERLPSPLRFSDHSFCTVSRWKSYRPLFGTLSWLQHCTFFFALSLRCIMLSFADLFYFNLF